jgi:hypothetical protein
VQFRTIINNKPLPYKIDYDKVLFFSGSCFSENIGQRFSDRKFNTVINPFGNIYNPISIFKNISRTLNNQEVSDEEITFSNELYFSFFHHTLLANTNKEAYKLELNKLINESHKSILSTNVLIITLGTAWVYETKSDKAIVANCHKLPSSHFEKRLLNISEITASFSEMFKELKKLNPKLKVIFTLSPVRHIKDGIEENNISKSILRVAIQEIVDYYEDCFYYPAYEIINDDLRDYRFYEKDLIHPNEQAVEYIWQNFLEKVVSENGKQTISKVEKILSAINHRPFNKSTQSHQKFIEKTLDEIAELEKELSGKFELEKNKLQE